MKSNIFLPLMATAILAGAMFFAGCEKENAVKTNDTCTLSDWYNVQTNDSTNYPFQLSFSDDPFQYAVYQSDMQEIFDNVENYFQTNNPQNEYFIFSLNEENGFFYYGLVFGMVSYGGYMIDTTGVVEPVDNVDEENDLYLFVPKRKISTTNEQKFFRWVDRRLQQGYTVTVWRDGNKYVASAKKLPNN